MDRQLVEFDRQLMERLQTLFLTGYALIDSYASSELQSRMYMDDEYDEQTLTLGGCVNLLGIPRPEDGNLMRALYEARPRIGWRADIRKLGEGRDILILYEAYRGNGDGFVERVPENMYIKPQRAGDLFGIAPEHVGELLLNMGIRAPKKTIRRYYYVDVLLVAAMLLDSWEGRGNQRGDATGGRVRARGHQL